MKTTLKTPRVLLREFVQEDAAELYELDSDPAVMRFMLTDGPPPLQVIRDAELPRRFSEYEKYPGRGIATEVSEAMVERAFAMNEVDRVVAEAAPDNAASIRVMEKAGLRFIAKRADANKVVYGLTREEWAS